MTSFPLDDYCACPDYYSLQKKKKKKKNECHFFFLKKGKKMIAKNLTYMSYLQAHEVATMSSKTCTEGSAGGKCVPNATEA